MASLLCAARLLAADDDLTARVVILANSRATDSMELAKFYASQRGIPEANIVMLPMSEAETISWREFIDRIYQPLQDELFRRGWIEGVASTLTDKLGRKRYGLTGHHISYLVVCRGVPLRVANDATLIDEEASRRIDKLIRKNEGAVDSELSLLTQSNYEITGAVTNPYYNRQQVSAVTAETVIKVSRLDGPSAESARALVTSALVAERQGLLGRYYVDLKGKHPDGDRWLGETQHQLQALGFDGDVEATPATFAAAARFEAPVFYFGWYHDDINGPFTVNNFSFPPGAIALHIHSFSAQTLRSTERAWCGPFVAKGVTATVGNVFEPYLQLTHRPDLLLQALARGENFGDAVYFSLPALSWQGIALGDPLYRPFKITLDEQETRYAQLPENLAPYTVIRRANLLWQAGHKTEAMGLLEGALQSVPNLAVGLKLAEWHLAEKNDRAATTALVKAAQFAAIGAGEWPLAREVAELLARQDADQSALLLYGLLASAEAPTVAARRELLIEARALAESAGDAKRLGQFSRELAELGEATRAQ